MKYCHSAYWSNVNMYNFIWLNKYIINTIYLHLYIDDINIEGSYKDYPALRFPVDGSEQIPPELVLLDWQSLDTASYYEYWIDTSSAFNSLQLKSGVKSFIENNSAGNDTEQEIADLMISTTYFWKVRAILGQDTLPWSSVWQFRTKDYASGIPSNTIIDKIQILPNPFSENVTVSSTDFKNGERYIISIVDALGNNVDQIVVSSEITILNTNTWNRGIYFISISNPSSGHISTKKILKL